MATETTTTTVRETERTRGNWKAGVVGGLTGGVVFGAMMVAMMPGVIEAGIPALWGLEGSIAGWFIHLSNAAIFGVVFAALAGYGLGGRVTYGRSIGLGAAYGVVLWVLMAVILMPVWLQAVGFAGAPPLPNINELSLVGHIVYGLVLGAVYPALEGL